MTSKTAIWATKVFIHNDYDSSRSFRPYGQLKIIIRNLVAVGIVIVGLTGYVHIMRVGGKPVVVLLDVLFVLVFLPSCEGRS
jgi:hypothetical protein